MNHKERCNICKRKIGDVVSLARLNIELEKPYQFELVLITEFILKRDSGCNFRVKSLYTSEVISNIHSSWFDSTYHQLFEETRE